MSPTRAPSATAQSSTTYRSWRREICEQPLHVDGQAEVVHESDGPRAIGDQALERVEVDVAGAGVAIEEHGPPAAQLHGVGGGDVGLGGHDHLVAGPQVDRQVTEVQRRHAGGGGDRVRGAGELREGALELLDLGAVRERGPGEYLGHGGPLVLADQRASERDRMNSAHRGQATADIPRLRGRRRPAPAPPRGTPTARQMHPGR